MNTSPVFDEGYNDEDVSNQPLQTTPSKSIDLLSRLSSAQECEDLAYQLLASLPRARLATIQRRLAPLLQFDVVGSLPAEVSLQIFSYLPFPALLNCALVCRRWTILANDQALWKNLCDARGWSWRQPSFKYPPAFTQSGLGASPDAWNDSDDEGMGDSDEEDEEEEVADTLMMSELDAAKAELTMMHAELDSGFASMSFAGDAQVIASTSSNAFAPVPSRNRVSVYSPPSNKVYSSSTKKLATARPRAAARHSAPSLLSSVSSSSSSKPNYKLLHQTQIKLQKRILTSSYRLSALQTRGAPTNSHTNTIYCLQLYTYPSSGAQVLFTGSRDKTVREWNLSTGLVERVLGGIHTSSVLSICVYNGILASAGSDRKVVVWDLERNKVMKVISDHEDSVLCVRFDEKRLVSCSKDRTVRTYLFPDLEPQFVLSAHRAAVNAVSISKTLIVSGSGDRSIRLWDANTGKSLRTFENHHSRGIASIDFKPPYVLSGSSDKHLRLFDITTLQGWSTSPDHDTLSGSVSHGLGSQAAPFPLPSSFVPAFLSQTVTAGNSEFQPTGFGYEPVQHNNVNTTFAFGQEGQPVLCQTCGNSGLVTLGGGGRQGPGNVHKNVLHRDLVRSVAFGDEFVLSGSYDLSIKVWDRRTGALVADLSGGHTGRIFCIGFDCTKVVSCGEDQVCANGFSTLYNECGSMFFLSYSVSVFGTLLMDLIPVSSIYNYFLLSFPLLFFTRHRHRRKAVTMIGFSLHF
ncbi:F-box/WD repeat-containing protein 11 [Lentinula detonsa]|uniref:F-box/WD repeat-containing protein 11 n=1 Tax=Lentinula detonsa TaxID=2804962 RepID=A0A9W8TY13_9AGAR|nr:F-box/WD repeat-containing protein 11 [Lentinula detonsa]